jgi:hypothetical protein
MNWLPSYIEDKFAVPVDEIANFTVSLFLFVSLLYFFIFLPKLNHLALTNVVRLN